MAITFTYTESTNKVVITEGTSGTPATFADFVTADRAGTDTKLLDAGSPASDLALTYAVRPVEDLAIIVKCVVANKTAEADFIFITGTDWRGAAQTESIDVTVGNGSYTSTEYWASITTLDCSDNANGGGTVWADGDLTVTQDVWGVIWDHGNGQYRIDSNFDIGDGGTSTYFKSTREMILFGDVELLNVLASATFHVGIKLNSESVYNGSVLAWGHNTLIAGAGMDTDMTWAGVVYLYDTQIKDIGTSTDGKEYKNPTINVTNASSEFILVILDNLDKLGFGGTLLYKYTTIKCWNGIRVTATIPTMSKCEALNCDYGSTWGGDNPVGSKITIYDSNTMDWYTSTYDGCTVIDSPSLNAGAGHIGGGAETAYVNYTVNIHINDKNGNDMSGASVIIQDVNNNIVSHNDSGTDVTTYFNHTATTVYVGDETKFNVGDYILIHGEWLLISDIPLSNTLTVSRGHLNSNATPHHPTDVYIQGAILTDGSGDIVNHIIKYREWYGTSETLTTHSPHKFIISYPGYETLVVDNVTVDIPIVWHLELQPMRARIYGRNHRMDIKQYV